MHEPEKIVVRIDQKGNAVIEVTGVKGDGCTALTEGLEQALGGSVTDRQLTSEYYEQTSEEERNNA